MKKSIIILGVALVTFTNVISALAQQSSFKEDSLTQSVSLNTRSTETKKSNTLGDSEKSNPETIVVPTYQKTMEEIIAENNQIIESDMSSEQYIVESVAEDNEIEISIEASPVSDEKNMEERIQQDIQIIEGSALNAISPLAPKKTKKK